MSGRGGLAPFINPATFERIDLTDCHVHLDADVSVPWFLCCSHIELQCILSHPESRALWLAVNIQRIVAVKKTKLLQ